MSVASRLSQARYRASHSSAPNWVPDYGVRDEAIPRHRTHYECFYADGGEVVEHRIARPVCVYSENSAGSTAPAPRGRSIGVASSDPLHRARRGSAETAAWLPACRATTAGGGTPWQAADGISGGPERRDRSALSSAALYNSRPNENSTTIDFVRQFAGCLASAVAAGHRLGR